MSFILVTIVKAVRLRRLVEHRKQYKTPSKVRAKMRKVVKKTIRDSPIELIDTTRVHRHGCGPVRRVRVRDEARTSGGVVVVEGDTTVGCARSDDEGAA